MGENSSRKNSQSGIYLFENVSDRGNVLSGKCQLDICSRETVRQQENVLLETAWIWSEVASWLSIWKTIQICVWKYLFESRTPRIELKFAFQVVVFNYSSKNWFYSWTLTFQKKCFICFKENPLRNDEKRFLFHLKSSFCSQDI